MKANVFRIFQFPFIIYYVLTPIIFLFQINCFFKNQTLEFPEIMNVSE